MRVPTTIPKLIVQGRRRHVATLAAKVSQSQLPNPSQTPPYDSSSAFYASALTSALVFTGVISCSQLSDGDAKDCRAFSSSGSPPLLGSSLLVTHNESSSKSMRQPRNVMLHRMRSKAGRGLNEKYKVDWKTVLGGMIN